MNDAGLAGGSVLYMIDKIRSGTAKGTDPAGSRGPGRHRLGWLSTEQTTSSKTARGLKRSPMRAIVLDHGRIFRASRAGRR